MVRDTPDTPESINVWGGTLCLDFANTVGWDQDFGHVEPERTDVLVSGPWVARWARRIGIPGRGRISSAEVERVRELRLVIHRLFSMPAPATRDLEALRAAVVLDERMWQPREDAPRVRASEARTRGARAESLEREGARMKPR